MAKNELDYDDLHDFFERGYDVSARSDTSWLFTSTERYVDWTVEFLGSGLTGAGDFPSGGTITRVIIKNPDGTVVDDVDGLSLSATGLGSGFELGDDHGSGGDDDLFGDDGDDDINGKGGDDNLHGEDGDDHLHGKGGDDHLEGGSGDDKLVGSGGKDDLSGDSGNDVLKGQGKNDRLDGGEDDDLLVGGGGKDVYIFGPDFGHDTIKKFQKNKDVIDLKATGLKFTDLTIEKAHGDAIITTSEGTITIDKLQGHGKSLDADDFLFSA